jgi:hypothetical protein
MSSTRRTEIPARHISISASSTELSRRRQRSMMDSMAETATQLALDDTEDAALLSPAPGRRL